MNRHCERCVFRFSLSPRGASGERSGERGRGNSEPPLPSPLLRLGKRGSRKIPSLPGSWSRFASNPLPFFWSVLVLLFLPLQGGAAFAYTAIYAFGDSLTDTGNRPSAPISYYEGRFSNGSLWIEYLSSKTGLGYAPDHNFARSTSTTAETLIQVEEFVAPDNPGDPLYVVWAGGNDFLNGLVNGLDADAWESSLTVAVNNLSNSVDILYFKGARAIVVPNSVDYGQVPGSALFPPILRLFVGSQVDLFNSMLKSALEDISLQHSDLDLRTVDIHSVFDELLLKPEAYGFTETAVSALQDPNLPDKSFQGPGKDYLFWDLIHPTSKVHAIIADRFFAALTPYVRLNAASSPGTLTLSFQGLRIGAVYVLQQTFDFVEWKDLTTVNAFSGNHDILLGDGSSAPSYYRLRSKD